MYERKSRLTSRQQGRLIEYFVAGVTARASAELVRVQPNTAIRFFMRLRRLIASKLPSYELSGEVEVDESYFGGRRKGMRGRGAAGKVAVFGLLNRGGNWVVKKLLLRMRPYLKGLKLRDYEFLSSEQEIDWLRWILGALKYLLFVLVVYLYLPVIFSIFPETKGIAQQLIGYILSPLKLVVGGFVNYIPELFSIAVILLVTRYLVRFLEFLSTEIEIGKLHLPNFYPDWARPTFNLVRIIVYAFAFVAIFPYLPGSDSPVFRGVSVFFGLLISLGSSSAIGNIIAGLVITYMRAFKIGDRVKIGDTTGDVVEKTMLVTRVRTMKNEEVTIPNSAILNGSTINYSSSSADMGLILHTTITIGYDVPWRDVERMLKQAAERTESLENLPEPYVLQTSLDDFYVSYQLNAFTRSPEKSPKIYSDLHAHIQDVFAEEGVEIMSPHYQANREGPSTIPPKNSKA